MLCLDADVVGCLSESLAEIVFQVGIVLVPHHTNDQRLACFGILHCHHEWLLPSILLLRLVIFHHEHAKFLEGQWKLKELDVREIVVLNDDISETSRNFHLLPLNE